MKNDLMKRMAMKKDKPKLNDVEKEAKLSVLNSLKSDMENMLGDNLKGIKKVTVASDSPQGLDMGLKKAQDLVHEHSDDESSEDQAHEASESPEFEQGEEEGEHEMEPSDEDDQMSEEELDSKLQKLMKLKEKMKSKA